MAPYALVLASVMPSRYAAPGSAVIGGTHEDALATLPLVQDRGHVALQQAVRDAGSDCLAVLVAAHPDDLWVMPAALLRFRYGWRVAVVLLTRGEGGQNSAGPEIGDELGRLRTLETEACAARLGVHAYYANRPDAGYCRTAVEALQLWNLESTASDLARLFRRLRPDLVLTTHHPAETHGHDLALLEILPRAVQLAGDPAFTTPELPPVQIQRVYRGAAPAEESRNDLRQLVMDEMDLARGETYRALAYAALREHASQEPFEPIDELCPPYLSLVPVVVPGQPPSRLLIEQPPSVFDELAPGSVRDDLRLGLEGDPQTGGLRDLLGKPQRLVERALKHRAQILQLAAVAEGALQRRLERRREALDRVIVHGCALHAAVVHVDGAAAVPAQDLPLRVLLHNGESFAFTDVQLTTRGAGVLTGNTSLDELPRKAAVTLEVSFRTPPEDGLPEDRLSRLFRADRYEPPLQLMLRARLQDQQLALLIDVPVPLLPPVELEVLGDRLLVPADRAEATLQVRVHRNSRAPLASRLQVRAPPGWVVGDAPAAVHMEQTTAMWFPFPLRLPPALQPDVYSLFVQLDKAQVRVPAHKVAVQIPPQLRVGIVEGVDDTASHVLYWLGAKTTRLADEDLAVGELRGFDTIMVDFRALRHRPAARAAFQRLLQFAENGGRLVVFYHKDTEFNVDSAGFVGSPYALHVGKGRVTQQDAPVAMLLPDHPLLTHPNKILADDWDGWVQERGLYFPDQYDARYQQLLAMADPGQPEERSALLYARCGKGEYVYCALSLYRQLKNLHPGACRLFANLMAPAPAAARGEGG